MAELRRENFTEGRFTVVFIGYGDEASNAVVELTYNWDQNPTLTSELGIRSIPTLKLFKQGEVIETVVGNQSLSSLEALLLKHA